MSDGSLWGVVTLSCVVAAILGYALFKATFK